MRAADYDAFLYDDHPFAATHPDRLGTVAALFGMTPAPAERCRVLELGCGLGGNVVAMAAAMPGSSFVGVDASSRQIEAGRADAEALGLRNVRLLARDLRDLGEDVGEVDYVICHGVYSWVAPDVQAAILDICRRHLAPQGVAYVSYNTYPGWHARGMVRDILRRHVPDDGTPAARVAAARAVLRFLAEGLPAARDPLADWLKSQVDHLRTASDAYLLYEYLVERNEPLWFGDFVARATAAGLRYVGDAELALMMPERYGAAVALRVRSMAERQVEAEQHLDLIALRYFRRSLLCRAEVPLDRGLSGARLRGLRVGTSLAPADPAMDPAAEGPAVFEGPEEATVTTSDGLLKAALLVLAARAPEDLDFESLTAAARARLGGAADEDLDTLGDALLEVYAGGQVSLGRWRRPVVAAVAERPVAFALARHRAARGARTAPNLQLESIALDPLDRVLLPRLDGAHDRAALVAAAVAAVAAGTVQLTAGGAPVRDPEVVADLVDAKVQAYLRASLLVDG